MPARRRASRATASRCAELLLLGLAAAEPRDGWQCDLAVGLFLTNSCEGHAHSTCEEHYVNVETHVARCVLSSSGACTASAPVNCKREHLHADAVAKSIHECTTEIATGLLSAVQALNVTDLSRNAKRYEIRLDLVAGVLQPVLNRFYPLIGYAGAHACAAIVTVPQAGSGETMTKSNVSMNELYSLLLFNSFVCPNIHGSERPLHMGLGLQRAALSFSCSSRPWKPLDFLQQDGNEGYLLVASQLPPEGNATHPPYLAHNWGCTNAGSQRTASHLSSTDGAQGIRHVQLSPQTCRVLRESLVSESEAVAKRQLQHFLSITEPRARGLHGVMHEFGVWFADMLLKEDTDDALDAAWLIFASHYMTVAPLHGFTWTLGMRRVTVQGEDSVTWIRRMCLKYLRSPTFHLFDPHNHFFGECAHGIGHLSYMKNGTTSLCQPPTAIESTLNQSGSSAKAVANMLNLWVHACSGGADHDGGDRTAVSSVRWKAPGCKDCVKVPIAEELL